ncbi:MAG: glycoside hydrolase family 16 protein [Prevotella sp.]|nr:glycoside hydrolase family 16 protein [Prevotella sp.]
MKNVLRSVAMSVVLAGGLTEAVAQQTGARPGYQMVFRDEFTGKNGSQPDTAIWTRLRKGPSTWDRHFSPLSRLGELRGGKLVLRGLPNRYVADDKRELLTGGFKTQGKFAFQYGLLEVRLKTRNRDGNFPAVWLLPQLPNDDKLYGGEIDVFETVDRRSLSYHTVHTANYADTDATDKKHIQKVFTKELKTDRWHVYGMEWTPTDITFYVDGDPVGTYRKSADSGELAKGQWPFDHPFYIIVNQAVGDGSWAKSADVTQKYETQIDWIRVYQK